MCDNIEMTLEQEEQEMAEFGLPDEHHVQAMIQAVEDTVEQQIEGNEHLALTDFQVYAATVLSMNGVKGLNTVSGQEGFFSSIGDGLKAAWEYITKMFKSIWQFFFGKEAAKELDEAEKEIKEVGVKLKALTKTKDPSPEAIKALENHLNGLVSNMKKLVANSKSPMTMTWRETKSEDPGFKAIASSVNDSYTKLISSTEEFIKWFDGLSGLSSILQVMTDKFILLIKSFALVSKSLRDNSSKMETVIKTTEKEISGSKDLNANAERKHNIKDLKAIMTTTASLATYVRNMAKGMVAATHKAHKAYGMEVAKD